VSPAAVTTLLQRLSDRDIGILESLRAHRLLKTDHIRRLHFAEGHATIGAAAGATMRVLTRLEGHNLAARTGRRIGGVRAGSSGICWQLAAAGDRLLRTMHGERRRRRYQEPSAAFTAHTLAVAELAVQLHELARRNAIELVSLDTEPSCWRSFLGAHGTREWLKPDLHAITASGDYEDHWYFEADLATEHPPVIVRKAKQYQRYAATGAYQARHGLFPAVVWVVPDPSRQRALRAALTADPSIQAALHRVVTTEQFAALITNQPSKGGST
jgi:protein involved in plasmid replication-relaxation